MNETMLSGDLKRGYDEYYEEDMTQWRWLGALDKAANIVSVCSSVPHNSILEIGAGEGSILKRLSELGFGQQLWALEISASGVEAINQKTIPRLKECKVFNGYDVPFDNDAFDLVVLSHVVEHVEHPRKLLYEAARVGKHLFIEVPLEDSIRLPQDYVANKTGHINYYSPKTIRRLLQTCDFTVLDQRITNASKAVYTYKKGLKGALSYFIKQCLLGASPALATKLFAYHCALLCVKRGSP